MKRHRAPFGAHGAPGGLRNAGIDGVGFQVMRRGGYAILSDHAASDGRANAARQRQ
jgi:hypothetical protein